MIYKLGDVLETKKGTMFVQCTLPLQGKLSGCILYWLMNDKNEDIVLNKAELQDILIKELRVAKDEVLDESYTDDEEYE